MNQGINANARRTTSMLLDDIRAVVIEARRQEQQARRHTAIVGLAALVSFAMAGAALVPAAWLPAALAQYQPSFGFAAAAWATGLLTFTILHNRRAGAQRRALEQALKAVSSA